MPALCGSDTQASRNRESLDPPTSSGVVYAVFSFFAQAFRSLIILLFATPGYNARTAVPAGINTRRWLRLHCRSDWGCLESEFFWVRSNRPWIRSHYREVSVQMVSDPCSEANAMLPPETVGMISIYWCHVRKGKKAHTLSRAGLPLRAAAT
jgi:hypothetical protein